MTNKAHKVIVVGLPKTGTSTLAVMLRMLNYKVTGPNINYSKGDEAVLNELYETNNGFQDYPWCFEWERFLSDSKVKFIVLKRDKASWYKSFYESYGGKDDRYLSFPFMNILKRTEHQSDFLDYFDTYYHHANAVLQQHPDRYIETSIDSLQWPELCDFLDEALPKNIFGKTLKKPHVNKKHSKAVKSFKYKITYALKSKMMWLIGEEKWVRLVIFLRKNNVI